MELQQDVAKFLDFDISGVIPSVSVTAALVNKELISCSFLQTLT